MIDMISKNKTRSLDLSVLRRGGGSDGKEKERAEGVSRKTLWVGRDGKSMESLRSIPLAASA